MALHKDFPDSPHAILDPSIRWFPADEALRETTADKLMPPLVHLLRQRVKDFRDSGYVGATGTSTSLLNWWFKTPHLSPQTNGPDSRFQYYFAQREALETIIYLTDVVGVKDKFDLMRFDSSGIVSAGMFDETWRRFVVKMATGSGKTMAALFPAIKALGDGHMDKLFFLTARTTGKSAAEAAINRLRLNGLARKSLTLTAKEKICFNPDKACNGEECAYARGYYDRLQEALEQAISYDCFTAESISELCHGAKFVRLRLR